MNAYNQIPDHKIAAGQLPLLGGELKKICDSLTGHDGVANLEVYLLHKHFLISDDEVLVRELREGELYVEPNIRDSNFVPAAWYVDRENQLVVLEYADVTRCPSEYICRCSDVRDFLTKLARDESPVIDALKGSNFGISASVEDYFPPEEGKQPLEISSETGRNMHTSMRRICEYEGVGQTAWSLNGTDVRSCTRYCTSCR